MSRNENRTIIRRLSNFLDKPSVDKTGTLLPVVNYILQRKKNIEKIAVKFKTPFYIYDKENVDGAINSFVSAFQKEIPVFKTYYALKLNHYPQIAKHAVDKGIGLDVGSPREIDMARAVGCRDMVYFSPGKTREDLLYALKYSTFITIHIDSFSELKKLGTLASGRKRKIRAGIRIHTDTCGNWKKYGIDIKELHAFWKEAKKYPFIDLRGIHFHVSRNKDAAFYENTIKELALYLKRSFAKRELKEIKYLDFGGGFEVYQSEGYYPGETPRGSIIKTINSVYGRETIFKETYYIRPAIRIEGYARKIGQAIKTYLNPLIKATYYSEPGRVICNGSMHIALSVVDVKDKKNVILDGGVNMVGWQRFEHEYFPLVNISSPAKREMACNMWGNLCTTWDIWGYYCYAKSLREGDIIIVPNQGALTYSLAQNFIQPIPPVYQLS